MIIFYELVVVISLIIFLKYKKVKNVPIIIGLFATIICMESMFYINRYYMRKAEEEQKQQQNEEELNNSDKEYENFIVVFE